MYIHYLYNPIGKYMIFKYSKRFRFAPSLKQFGMLLQAQIAKNIGNQGKTEKLV